MPKVAVYDMRGTQVGEIDLNDRVFGIEPNEAVMQQFVKMQLANKRQGTASTKTRAEVRGGEETLEAKRNRTSPGGQQPQSCMARWRNRFWPKTQRLFLYTSPQGKALSFEIRPFQQSEGQQYNSG